jgi:hypothetical protein
MAAAVGILTSSFNDDAIVVSVFVTRGPECATRVSEKIKTRVKKNPKKSLSPPRLFR